MTFGQFTEACARHGLTTRDCGNFHWQILGGRVLVNYYPTAGTIFVDAAAHGEHGSVADAIVWAQTGSAPRGLF